LFSDADGNVVDGDQVLAACAVEMKKDGELDGNLVVSTVMANTGFGRAMEQFGIRVILAPVGDRYVLEQMLEHGAVLGGEQSGHVIFRHHATTGDGLITAVRFLSLAKRNDVTVAELASTMRRFPQVTINVEVAAKDRLEDAAEVWDAVTAVETALDGTGRVLVRSSGTEPLVRVMVEAESEQDARRHADAIAERIRSALG
jgi:phosphoglucosamine mutase